jgi:hypothetical protein
MAYADLHLEPSASPCVGPYNSITHEESGLRQQASLFCAAAVSAGAEGCCC